MESQPTAKLKRAREPRPRTVETGSRSGGKYEAPAGQVLFDLVVYRGVDFGGQKFEFFVARGGTFEDCSFRRARFGNVWFSSGPQTIYRRCDFREADLRDADLGQARFEECDFSRARIDHWNGQQAEFVGCRFAGQVTHSAFSGRVIGPGKDRLDPQRAFNEFRGNDFTGADLRGTSFRHGIDVDLQRWPSSSDYQVLDKIVDRIARARRAVSTWADAKDREDALIGLGTLELLTTDQSKLVYRAYDPADPIPAHVQRRIAGLLKDSL